MGDPLIPPLLLLTKMLSLGAVAMKSTERKLLQAITTPFFRHMPQIQFLAILVIFDHFCPPMGDQMIPPVLLFTKMLPLGAVSMRSMERTPFQLTFYMAKNSLTWILDYLGLSWMS